MTEPTPALVYRDRAQDFSRAPLLMVLAILAIVFGIVGAAMNVAGAYSLASYILRRMPAPQTSTLKASLVSALIATPANLTLAAAGAAFIGRSRRVPTLMLIYVVISMASAMTFIIPIVVPPVSGAPFWSLAIAQAVPALARLVFLAIVLLLLRAEPVRMLINIASGAEQPLQPLLTE